MDERVHEGLTKSIRQSYDRVADEYARRIFNELELSTGRMDNMAAGIRTVMTGATFLTN